MSNFEDYLNKAFAKKNLTSYQILKAAEKALGSKKAVASELGVSARTVQRWMKQGKTKAGRMNVKADNAGQIKKLGSTPVVRQVSRSSKKSKQFKARGARLNLSAMQGPHNNADYMRERLIALNISPEGMQEIEEAWLMGDPDNAREVTREVIEREYGVSGWNWEDDKKFEMHFD